MPHETNLRKLLGSIEAGGTHFKCAIGYGDGATVEIQTLPTTSPAETYINAVSFFRQHERSYGPVEALGIAHFGPLELDPNSDQYGQVLSTVKPGWSSTEVLGFFRKALNVPIALQTDVNGAAIGERYFGAAKGYDDFVYVTVGTGIGASVSIGGKLVHGGSHPEIGHIEIHQNSAIDTYPGTCTFHGNCLEGLASGPAIEQRWGLAGEKLPEGHPAWELQAKYLASLCANLRYCYAPKRIIFGGGVMSQKSLLPLIRKHCEDQINAYIPPPSSGYDNFIVATQLNGMAALKGGLLMATELLASG